MSDRLLSSILFSAIFVSASISVIVASEVQTVSPKHESVARDGDYIGLEKMPNLTPEVQGSAWFHENTLLVRSDETILEKVPVMVLHGKKTYSASDGGFLTYRAKFVRKDGQNVINLRLFESEYVMFPEGKHDQYTEIKTYPVTFVSDQIEFGGVRYKSSKVESWKLDRLLPLLNMSRWRYQTPTYPGPFRLLSNLTMENEAYSSPMGCMWPFKTTTVIARSFACSPPLNNDINALNR